MGKLAVEAKERGGGGDMNLTERGILGENDLEICHYDELGFVYVVGSFLDDVG